MDAFAGPHATAEAVHHGEQRGPFAVGEVRCQATSVHFAGQSIGDVEGPIFRHGTPPTRRIGQQAPGQFPRIDVLYFDGPHRPARPPSLPSVDVSGDGQHIGTGLIVHLLELTLRGRIGFV